MSRVRRKILSAATLALVALGLAGGAYTLLSTFGPSEAVLASQGVSEIDLGAIPPGHSVTVEWHDLPVTVLHRTEDQLKQLPTLENLRLNREVTTAVPDPEGLIPELRSYTREYFVVYGWTGNAIQCGSKYAADIRYVHPGVKGAFEELCRGAWHDVTGRLLKKSWAEGGDLPIPPHSVIDGGRVKLGPVNDNLLRQWRNQPRDR